MAANRFVVALHAKPLLLDAGMGTRLMARGLDHQRDDPSLWSLDHPEIVAEIHRADVAAGSDAIVSNTFGANRFWLERFGREQDVAAINHRAVQLARDAGGPDRLVIGSIGPSAAQGGESSYREQASLLAEAGVDALILETHTAETATFGLLALTGTTSLPILVSLCSWPENVVETARRFLELGASGVGTNCGTSPDAVLPPTEALAGHVENLIAKPSGFFPPDPDRGPEAFRQIVPKLLALGVRLMGGCCGTDERYIAAMRTTIDSRKETNSSLW